MFDIFIFDNNINCFSRVWLFEHRIFYNNIYFFNDKKFAKANSETKQINLFYFIKATKHTSLDKAFYRSQVSNIIEDLFIGHNIEPIKLIYYNDGQIAFKIYHYEHGDFD